MTAGKGTSSSQSYGNSGDQARAVISGLPTDIAALSLEPDVTKLVDEKLVAANWNATPTKEIVTRSVVALAVRNDNPKIIERVAKVGFEVRVEAALGNGSVVPIQVTRDGAEQLQLRAGQIVWMRVHLSREFAA